MLPRAPSSGLFASAPLTRQITCHPIYTSLLPPSNPGFNFRRAFRLSHTITTVSLIGRQRVSPAICWYCPRLRFIGRRYAAVDAYAREQTLERIAVTRDWLQGVEMSQWATVASASGSIRRRPLEFAFHIPAIQDLHFDTLLERAVIEGAIA